MLRLRAFLFARALAGVGLDSELPSDAEMPQSCHASCGLFSKLWALLVRNLGMAPNIQGVPKWDITFENYPCDDMTQDNRLSQKWYYW